MKIVLIGFACCYKSSAGKLLAAKFNYNYVDVDKTVEDIAGKTVAEIFATEGEQAFRRKERDALIAFSHLDNIVISCGGGSALCPDFKLLADNSTVVWLTANAQTVAARLGDTPRPLFDGRTVDDLARQIDSRVPYYAKYADFTVSTDGLKSNQVADILFDKLS